MLSLSSREPVSGIGGRILVFPRRTLEKRARRWSSRGGGSGCWVVSCLVMDLVVRLLVSSSLDADREASSTTVCLASSALSSLERVHSP